MLRALQASLLRGVGRKMAAFDANLMIRSTTGTVVSAGGVALAGTTAFLDLGTGGTPAAGLTIRLNVNSADVTTSSMAVRYDFGDDGSTALESYTAPTITGTQARQAGGFEQIVRVAHKRRYVRAVPTLTGAAANFGVVTIGIDAGEFSQAR
jgi:hypothetical protein